VNRAQQDLLRRLALNDRHTLDSLLGAEPNAPDRSTLGPKTHALVRIAGLVAVDAPAASYQWSVSEALAAGASDTEIVGVLVALLPVVGTVRVSAAAPEVALALGWDVGHGR
jgi:4-carboxymuconolactone decarboxylase